MKTEFEHNNEIIEIELKKIMKRNRESLDFLVDIYMSQLHLNRKNIKRLKFINQQLETLKDYL